MGLLSVDETWFGKPILCARQNRGNVEVAARDGGGEGRCGGLPSDIVPDIDAAADGGAGR